MTSTRTTLSTLSTLARHWRRHRLRGDSGTMAFYLIIAVAGMALGALIVPMIVSSSQVTRSDTSREHAVDAAQAGINVMVGQIRKAQVAGVGTSTLLPCGTTSGSVNGTGVATYSVSVAYYVDDPVKVVGATKMRCVAGYGTYDPVSGGFTPKYARITAVGKDGPAVNGVTPGRTLQSTYVFRTSNGNIVGGQIRIYPAPGASTSMCMDAGSTTPIAGVQLKLQTCANPAIGQQVFAYRTDLTLQLLSSVTATYPNGLCLDQATPTSQTSPIVFKACAALSAPPYTQQWSFNDNGNFEAATATSAATGALAGRCISVATQNAGELAVLGGCGTTVSPTSAWIPSPAAGAGAAQSPQLINYYEFGRCMDVTGANPGVDHLIDYPCKQNPNANTVLWNQKFTLPTIAVGASSGTGQISTNNGSKYCLTSPGTAGGYVVVRSCSDTNPQQTWTVYNGSSSLTYSAKYQIVDTGGRCLGLGPPYPQDVWSTVVVEPCTGATEQKWNAAPNLTDSGLQDTDEIANTP